MSLLRSMLFAPGNHPRRVQKALSSAADAVILDLEDACPVAEKERTRVLVAQALGTPRRMLGYVRINALETEFAYGDLQAVARAGVDGLMLPKVESAEQLYAADWLMGQLEREHGLPPRSIDLLPLIETAKGFAALREIAAANSRVRRLAFGAADFTTDMGIAWSTGELELSRFRTDLVLASRAAGLEAPIDLACLSLSDRGALGESIQWGARLGFQGKLCIHPQHVDAINSAFTPSEALFADAQRVIAAFRAAEAQGSAAIQVNGRLVDYPAVRRAERIVATVQKIRSGKD